MLKKIREAKNLSQGKLVDLMKLLGEEVSQTELSFIENCQTKPTPGAGSRPGLGAGAAPRRTFPG